MSDLHVYFKFCDYYVSNFSVNLNTLKDATMDNTKLLNKRNQYRWRIQDFPDEPQRMAIWLRKLHEIEKKFDWEYFALLSASPEPSLDPSILFGVVLGDTNTY